MCVCLAPLTMACPWPQAPSKGTVCSRRARKRRPLPAVCSVKTPHGRQLLPLCDTLSHTVSVRSGTHRLRLSEIHSRSLLNSTQN